MNCKQCDIPIKRGSRRYCSSTCREQNLAEYAVLPSIKKNWYEPVPVVERAPKPLKNMQRINDNLLLIENYMMMELVELLEPYSSVNDTVTTGRSDVVR